MPKRCWYRVCDGYDGVCDDCDGTCSRSISPSHSLPRILPSSCPHPHDHLASLPSSLSLPLTPSLPPSSLPPSHSLLCMQLSKEEKTALKKTSIKKGPPGKSGGAPRPKGKSDKKPIAEYTVGSMVPGKVVSIMPYGAFVDIGSDFHVLHVLCPCTGIRAHAHTHVHAGHAHRMHVHPAQGLALLSSSPCAAVIKSVTR